MTRLLLAFVILFASIPRGSWAQSTANVAGDSGARTTPAAAATSRHRPPRNYNPAFTGVYYPDVPEPDPIAVPAENGTGAAEPAPGDSAGAPASGGSSSSAPAPPAGPRPSSANRSRAADTGVYYPDSPTSGAAAAGSNEEAAAVGVYHPDPPPVPPPGARETRVATGDSGMARRPRRGPITAADTLVASACGDAPAGSEAPGLLGVLFRARTTEEARHAAAKQAGGTIAGESGEGENYVRFPPDAGASSAVADRLIQMGPVMRVSPVACPGPGH